ncbi:hypothetical protein BRADI_2g42004v3 [Brachypodium distachyon]|uniref:Reverse transcriptase zinc-binding domain-containing protein n=1 Tax=Brachypodium distachyon TaxID=15368 RepID=A0A2K2DDB9_BRADI|nr:hypothetical protein BRADI_2g42004v3 [Brachypodium distachyon]
MFRRRQYTINSSWDCVLCPDGKEETLDHLFFDCLFSRHCWTSLGIAWDMNLPLFDRLRQVSTSWRGGLFWETFILAAWSLWQTRNAKIFENKAPALGHWKARLKTDLALLAFRSQKEEFKSKLAIILAAL